MQKLIPLACLLTLVACGSSPTSPSAAASVTGTWLGTITSEQVAGSGSARVDFAGTNSNLTGTWSVTGPSGPDSGTLNGAVNGSAVTLTLTPSVPVNCPYAVTATMSGTQLTGTYAATNCSQAVSGGLSLTKVTLVGVVLD
jgi:hypothetical protein